ncbi:hypothetical protein OROHE_020487 [Orobanche hederae]
MEAGAQVRYDVQSALTHKKLLSEMDEIIPNFLLCLHEALANLDIFINVGEDSTTLEEKEACRYRFRH